MKRWEECLKDEVSDRSKDMEQAKSLLKMARIRERENEEREITGI